MPEALLPQPAETIAVRERTVACDGGPLGHPRIYLHIKDRDVVCPYCSRRFVLEAGAGEGGGH